MSKVTRTRGMLQRWLSRPAPAFDDAADLGTAFGLEVSLDQPGQVPVLAAPAPSRAPGWVRRHVLRHRAAP
jgi:hypothetical protein